MASEEYLNSKILIVDDSDDNVNLLESILLDAGYQHIRSTLDSREASKIYKEIKRLLKQHRKLSMNNQEEYYQILDPF